MLAGTPWHKYFDDKQWKCLQPKQLTLLRIFLFEFINKLEMFEARQTGSI